MNWAWATSLDQIWRSPAFPMWLTLAAAGFFGILVIVTLLRAEKSVANGALTVITLLAVGVAVASTIRGFGPGGRGASGEAFSRQATSASLPAFSCIDDLAGEAVLTACEKALFGSPESAAAAVSHTASLVTRLTSFGDVATANKNMTPELQALRHSVERDRYGLVAQVLLVRDHCLPSECAAFASLADRHQIVANMDERTYDVLVARYAPAWNAPSPANVAAGAPSLSSLPPGVSLPTGKPTNADFPTSASIPPVSIMNPEPGPKAASTTPAAAPSTRATPPAASSPGSAPSTAPSLASAKKPPAPKQRAAAPVQIAPAPAASTAEPN